MTQAKPNIEWQSESAEKETIIFCPKFAVKQQKLPDSEPEDEDDCAPPTGTLNPVQEIRFCLDLSSSLVGSSYMRLGQPRAQSVALTLRPSRHRCCLPPSWPLRRTSGLQDDLIKSYHQVCRRRDKVRAMHLYWHHHST